MSDLISRQVAITLPVLPKEYREYQTFNLDDAYEKGWMDCQESIANIPSAEPRKGKWMLWNEPGNEYAWCTACGEKFDQSDLYIGGTDYPKYCPECGARMDE